MAKASTAVGAEQGVALIERVIEKVKAEGFAICDAGKIKKPKPVPADVVEKLRFPNGERPSPSLVRWMQFDGSWLTGQGWFEKRSFVPVSCKIGEFAAKEYGDEWLEHYGALEAKVGGDFYLLPLGADSRRALYVGKPDSLGEHPVVVTDNDDIPYVALMYPGFDIYMAHLAGLVELKFGTYEALHGHPVYGARIAEHQDINFGGQQSFDYGQVAAEVEAATPAWKEGDPVPDGYRVAKNPFTGESLLVRGT